MEAEKDRPLRGAGDGVERERFMRWIIGDIHGMLRPLSTLLAEVQRFDAESQLIFVGDYINRGPQARGVIDYLLTLTNASFIRGNHDDIFDLVINGQSYAENDARGSRVDAFLWFMKYGLDSTMLSYDCDYAFLESLTDRCTAALLDQLAEVVPAAHRAFIRNLPAVYEAEEFFVVHGKWSPDELAEAPSVTARLEKQPSLRHGILWDRFSDEEIYRTKAWQRTGFFGHTPVSFYHAGQRGRRGAAAPGMVPIVGQKMVLLDTAAALGQDGRLTAYCVEDGSYIQVDHFGKLLGRQTAAS